MKNKLVAFGFGLLAVSAILLSGCGGPASLTPSSPTSTAPDIERVVPSASQPIPTSSPRLPAAPTVPAQYQSLYNELQGYVTNMDKQVAVGWDGSTYAVDYAAELLTADENAGPGILQPSTQQVMTEELDGERSLGVQAVTVQIGFPIFDQDFYVSAGESSAQADQSVQQWLSYYQALALAIHSRGLKMVVEANPLLSAYISATSSFNPASYYKSLDFATYEKLRSQHNIVVAQQIKPDYLLLQTEPQTDAFNDYRPELNNPAQDTAMIRSFVTDLDSAGIVGLHTSIQLGSGVGTWQPYWNSFISTLAGISGLDKLDTHIYSLEPSVNKIGEVAIASQIADLAHAAGKGVSMSEVWFHKSDSLGGLTGEAINEIQARDVLSFWAPLDQQFFPVLVKLANSKRFDYVSCFGHYNWFALTDYDSLSSPPAYQVTSAAQNATIDTQIIRMQNQAARQALAAGQLTATGKAYQAAIARSEKR